MVFCGAGIRRKTPLFVGGGFCAGLERAGFCASRLEWAWNIFVTGVDWDKDGGETLRGTSGSRISGLFCENGLVVGRVSV